MTQLHLTIGESHHHHHGRRNLQHHSGGKISKQTDTLGVCVPSACGAADVKAIALPFLTVTVSKPSKHQRRLWCHLSACPTHND